jgi:putative DNA primase/helicase
MDLLTFCRLHGILINHVPPIGVWKRFPTEDHPRSFNGAVKFMGNYAHVQNHAVMLEPVTWQADEDQKIDPQKIVRLAKEQDDRTAKLQADAAARAAWIVNQCQVAKHEYLHAKGFPDEQGLVWLNDEAKLLVIPMRIENRIVGCQLIDTEGDKKFLFGQKTAGAAMVFDNKGIHVLCEGYATGLSVKDALRSMKRRYTIHVCFSAGNMVKVARTLPAGFVVVDHDKPNPQTGTRAGHVAAAQIGWPSWMSEVEGEDANDTHQRLGLFKFSQSIVRSMPVV